MSDTIYLGIDNGLLGAVAALHPDGRVEFHDTPYVEVERKTKSAGKAQRKEYDAAQMVIILRQYAGAFVALERPMVMPSQQINTALSVGIGGGLWQGILSALLLPHEIVPPATWKAAMYRGSGLSTSDKNASRILAARLFPQAAEQLKRVKDDGRAEALLLAEWGRRRHAGG